jgi:hypothetical protein
MSVKERLRGDARKQNRAAADCRETPVPRGIWRPVTWRVLNSGL